jgi:hypothetical protein
MEIIIQAEYLDFALLDFKAFLAAGLYSVASVQSLRACVIGCRVTQMGREMGRDGARLRERERE